MLGHPFTPVNSPFSRAERCPARVTGVGLQVVHEARRCFDATQPGADGRAEAEPELRSDVRICVEADVGDAVALKPTKNSVCVSRSSTSRALRPMLR